MAAKKPATFRIVFHCGQEAYAVRPLPVSQGWTCAYRLTKADGTSYDVSVDGYGAACECLGFLRWGRCKHVRMLRAAGMVPPAPAPLPVTA